MIVAQEDEVEHERQVRRLEQRLRRLDIIGTPGTLVAGNLEQGYSVDTGRQGGGIGGGGGEPVVIGACCHVDGSCDIQTASDCDFIGGAYQGDWTACEDVDCTHTGACCDGEVCTITTEVDCAGTYQGDGTDCDPNPCACDECSCFSCDGGCTHYLTATDHTYFYQDGAACDDGSLRYLEIVCDGVGTCDPDTGIVTWVGTCTTTDYHCTATTVTSTAYNGVFATCGAFPCETDGTACDYTEYCGNDTHCGGTHTFYASNSRVLSDRNFC